MIFLETVSALPAGIIGELFTKWEQAGFFSYLLPFLLIFAMVFGILIKTNIFKDNKMVNGLIALAVALMSLQFNFVPQFFSQIFPRVGVALAIILGIFIVAGLFIDPNSKWINYVLLGVGVLIIGIVIIQTAGALGWASGQWWEDNYLMVIGAIVLFILVAIVIGGTGNKQPKEEAFVPFYAKHK